MKQTKRIVSLLLALVMVVGMLAACDTNKPVETKPVETQGNEKPTETQPKETEAPEFDPRTITEGVTLTIAVPYDDEVIDWETNLMTLMIEEELGVDLKFDVYAAADYSTKLNMMVQGGDKLPDIILKTDKNSALAWAEAGAIIPLNEFYENPDYCKYIGEIIDRAGWFFPKSVADAEGNIWGMGSYGEMNHGNVSRKVWINTEYAAACGFDIQNATTISTEDYFELCKAFVAAGDLNGNGLDDEVIFSGRGINNEWFKTMMAPFGAYCWDDKFLDVEEDGTLKFAFAKEEYKEGLKYIKKFFDEGLLDTTILTQDSASHSAIVTSDQHRALVQFYYYAQINMPNAAEQMEARLRYTALGCLEGPTGIKESYYSDPVATIDTVITADCENPEAAFIVMDYLNSPTIATMHRYGEEGKDWDYYENVDDSKFIDGTKKENYLSTDGSGDLPDVISYTNATYWGHGNPQNAGWMGAGPVSRVGYPKWGYAMVGGDTEEARIVSKWWDYYYNVAYPVTASYIPERTVTYLPMTEEEIAVQNEIWNILFGYVQEASANFITSAWDIDEQWDSYLAELEKMGMNELLATYQTSYDRTK